MRFRCERGQGVIEYAGVLVLVALAVAALASVGLPGTIAGAVGKELSTVLGGGAGDAGHPGSGLGTGGAPGSGSAGQAPAGTPSAAGGAAGNRGPQSTRLPTGGQRPYVPPKKAHGKPQRVRGGGFEDANGNVWKWDPSGHAGPHWDVEHPDGSHTNVSPEGQVIGPDNFPNKAPTGSGGDSGGGDSGDTVKKAAGGAAVIGGTGAIIWWGLKILSPACGPLAPACAIFG